MSKGIKRVASIALPIVGAVVGGPVGAAIGGAIGGGMNGGGLKGALIGGIGGYASAGLTSGLIGAPAGATLGQVTGNAALQGPTLGSGIRGALTGGGIRALGTGITSAASSLASPIQGLSQIGNLLMTKESADAAKEAARLQQQGIDAAAQGQQPYTQLGADAVSKINQIQKDPAGYIQNNQFYSSLAKDAERRLLASEAAKGKVGSGGTAAALQDQLLQLGNGLVNQEINRLQGQANTGQASANTVSDLAVGRGNAGAAGVVGQNNAYQSGYQQSIGGLLALQDLNKTPPFNPTATIYR